MTLEEFWSLLAASREAMTGEVDGNMDRQAARLRDLLFPLEPASIIEFRDHFQALVDRASDWDLWAVAYIIGQGCSDDWFDYFRFWLVSLGRERYERALASPEAVDEIFSESGAEDIFFEEISYVPGEVYREKTARDIPSPETSEGTPMRGEP